MPRNAGSLKRGRWCQRLERTRVGRDTPYSAQKLRDRAIRRHLPGGLNFLTPDASERPLCPWLSRAFLPEICLSFAVIGPQTAGGRGKPRENLDQMKPRGRGLHTAQPAGGASEQ